MVFILLLFIFSSIHSFVRSFIVHKLRQKQPTETQEHNADTDTKWRAAWYGHFTYWQCPYVQVVLYCIGYVRHCMLFNFMLAEQISAGSIL